MNRLEATRQVLLLEAAAAQIQARAQKLREAMNADAKAEFEEHGTAATWRLPDIGTWSQPVSQTRPTVLDVSLLVGWVKQRYPSEIVELVSPPFQRGLLERMECEGEHVIDPSTGEIVPGLGVRQGGDALTLRFKPNGDALAVADQVGAKLAGQILDGLGIAAGGDPA